MVRRLITATALAQCSAGLNYLSANHVQLVGVVSLLGSQYFPRLCRICSTIQRLAMVSFYNQCAKACLMIDQDNVGIALDHRLYLDCHLLSVA